MSLIESVLPNFLPSFAFDSVAIFTQDYNQIFVDARAIKAVVKEEAKVMQHPVETGATIVDHRIILPTEIELSLILLSDDYQSTYNNIREYYFNSTLLIIQTRSGVYDNQIIQSMPHEEDPSQYDVLTLALSLKEVQFVTAQYGTTPANASNMNTSNRGVQQGTAANGSQETSIAKDLLNKSKVTNPKGLMT
jgi:hypothetical protein